MRVLLITNSVDLGTKSISLVYKNHLKPEDLIEIPNGVRFIGLNQWIRLIMRTRKAATEADRVICVHHAAIVMGALFLPRNKNRRIIGIADWTRAFPSLRTGLYIRCYNRIYSLVTQRLDRLYTISEGLRMHYRESIHMELTMCPLPFPEVTPLQWSTDRIPSSILFVGANIRRKAGDILIEKWREKRPEGATLSFVSPESPMVDLPRIEFFRNIKANTNEHKKLFDTHEIFLLPTHRDSYGLAVLEAMNLGMIPVTTRHAGISSLVEMAGGLVGETPEDAIEKAFVLAVDPAAIIAKRVLLNTFMTNYPHLVNECLNELLHDKS